MDEKQLVEIEQRKKDGHIYGEDVDALVAEVRRLWAQVEEDRIWLRDYLDGMRLSCDKEDALRALLGVEEDDDAEQGEGR